MREHSWPDMKRAYIYGVCSDEGQITFPTLAQLAEENHISHTAVLHRAAAEEWTRLRREAQERITEAAFAQYEGEMTTLLGHIDRQIARGAAALSDIVMEHIESAATPRERRALVGRYSKQLSEILSAGHSAIGVERVIERAEAARQEYEKRGA